MEREGTRSESMSRERIERISSKALGVDVSVARTLYGFVACVASVNGARGLYLYLGREPKASEYLACREGM